MSDAQSPPELDAVEVGDPDAPDLLVLLHGYDDDPADILRLVTRLDPEGRFRVIAPRGPALTAHGAAWYVHDGQAREAEIRRHAAAIEQLVAGFTASGEGAVAIVGFSQGGSMGLATALLAVSWRPAAVACLCGYLPDLGPNGPELSAAADVPILMITGDGDDVMPRDLVELGSDALTSAGVEVERQSFDMGHTVTAEAAVAAGRWLSRRLGPAPF